MRIGAAVALLCAPAQRALAQGEGGGPPSEQTVAELRQNLEVFMQFDQQRQQFGFPPNPNVEIRQIELLEADFDENILPGLEFAENDCFFAEVPVGKALDWTRQVQLLGFGDEFGPLWEEASVVQESLMKILQNCHKQMYEACVLDDSDPNAALLPGVTRQLSLLDGDPIYEEKSRRCSFGWHGTVDITESMSGNLSGTQSLGSTSTTTRAVFTGNRTVHIERLSRIDPTTGQADGRAQETTVQVATAGKCTFTTTSEWSKTASGSGMATLLKHGSAAGDVTIAFSAPNETGTQKMTANTSVNDTKCGSNGKLPDSSAPLPTFGWPGQVTDKLEDPLSEVISGTKSLVFTFNDAGAIVPARASSDPGGIARIPAIPGAPNVDGQAFPLFPWLSIGQPPQDLTGEPVTIKMDVKWSLKFGE